LRKDIFSMLNIAYPILGGGDTIHRAVIVPGTTIGSGRGSPPPPLVIRALVSRLYIPVQETYIMHAYRVYLAVAALGYFIRGGTFFSVGRQISLPMECLFTAPL